MSKADGSQQQPTGELGVVLDRRADVPIGVQLAWALRARIAGELAPGQRLPGVRELAQETGVNVNTARAVYQRLEQEGLIESHRGSGTFVAVGRPEGSRIGTIAADAARKARSAGVDPREVAAALYVSAQLGERGSGAAAERRTLLRAQITSLESALSEIEAAYPALVTSPRDVPSDTAAPRLLSGPELEEVRAGLMRRLAAVQAAIDDAALEDRRASSTEPPATGKTASGKAAAAKSSVPARKPKAPARARPAPAGA